MQTGKSERISVRRTQYDDYVSSDGTLIEISTVKRRQIDEQMTPLYAMEPISRIPKSIRSQLLDNAYSIMSSKDYLMNVIPHCNQFSVLSLSNQIYIWRTQFYPCLIDTYDNDIVCTLTIPPEFGHIGSQHICAVPCLPKKPTQPLIVACTTLGLVIYCTSDNKYVMKDIKLKRSSSIISLTPYFDGDHYRFIALCSNGDLYTIWIDLDEAHIREQSVNIQNAMNTDTGRFSVSIGSSIYELENDCIHVQLSYKNPVNSLMNRLKSLFVKQFNELPSIYSSIIPCYYNPKYFYIYTRSTVSLLSLNIQTSMFEYCYTLDVNAIQKRPQSSSIDVTTNYGNNSENQYQESQSKSRSTSFSGAEYSYLYNMNVIVGIYQSKDTLYVVKTKQYQDQYNYIISAFTYNIKNIQTPPKYSYSLTIPTTFTFTNLLSTMNKVRLIIYEKSLYLYNMIILLNRMFVIPTDCMFVYTYQFDTKELTTFYLPISHTESILSIESFLYPVPFLHVYLSSGDTLLIPQQIELYSQETLTTIPFEYNSNVLFVNDYLKMEPGFEDNLKIYYDSHKPFPSSYSLFCYFIRLYEKHYNNTAILYYHIYKSLLSNSFEDYCKQYIESILYTNDYIDEKYINESLYIHIQSASFHFDQFIDYLIHLDVLKDLSIKSYFKENYEYVLLSYYYFSYIHNHPTPKYYNSFMNEKYSEIHNKQINSIQYFLEVRSMSLFFELLSFMFKNCSNLHSSDYLLDDQKTTKNLFHKDYPLLSSLQEIDLTIDIHEIQKHVNNEKEEEDLITPSNTIEETISNSQDYLYDILVYIQSLYEYLLTQIRDLDEPFFNSTNSQPFVDYFQVSCIPIYIDLYDGIHQFIQKTDELDSNKKSFESFKMHSYMSMYQSVPILLSLFDKYIPLSSNIQDLHIHNLFHILFEVILFHEYPDLCRTLCKQYRFYPGLCSLLIDKDKELDYEMDHDHDFLLFMYDYFIHHDMKSKLFQASPKHYTDIKTYLESYPELQFLFELKTNTILPFSKQYYNYIIQMKDIKMKGEYLSMVQLLALSNPKDPILSEISEDLSIEIQYNDIESHINDLIHITHNTSLEPKDLILILTQYIKEMNDENIDHESSDSKSSMNQNDIVEQINNYIQQIKDLFSIDI